MDKLKICREVDKVGEKIVLGKPVYEPLPDNVQELLDKDVLEYIFGCVTGIDDDNEGTPEEDDRMRGKAWDAIQKLLKEVEKK